MVKGCLLYTSTEANVRNTDDGKEHWSMTMENPMSVLVNILGYVVFGYVQFPEIGI